MGEKCPKYDQLYIADQQAKQIVDFEKQHKVRNIFSYDQMIISIS